MKPFLDEQATPSSRCLAGAQEKTRQKVVPIDPPLHARPRLFTPIDWISHTSHERGAEPGPRQGDSIQRALLWLVPLALFGAHLPENSIQAAILISKTGTLQHVPHLFFILAPNFIFRGFKFSHRPTDATSSSSLFVRRVWPASFPLFSGKSFR